MKEKTFKQKCLENNISYSAAVHYKSRNPELTDEQVISHYVGREKTFRQKCLENNIEYSRAKTYRSAHPELTDEQVISHYKHPEINK